MGNRLKRKLNRKARKHADRPINKKAYSSDPNPSHDNKFMEEVESYLIQQDYFNKFNPYDKKEYLDTIGHYFISYPRLRKNYKQWLTHDYLIDAHTLEYRNITYKNGTMSAIPTMERFWTNLTAVLSNILIISVFVRQPILHFLHTLYALILLIPFNMSTTVMFVLGSLLTGADILLSHDRLISLDKSLRATILEYE